MARYLPVALALEGEGALVVGGDGEATAKARRLVEAGARVSVVWPEVEPALEAMAASGALRWYARTFRPDDLRGVRVAVLTARDPVLAQAVRRATREACVWLSAVDRPALSDFVNVAAADVGPLGIAVTSHGRAPALAARVRDALRDGLDGDLARFGEAVARERESLGGASLADRRARMKALLDGLELSVSVTLPGWFSEGAP